MTEKITSLQQGEEESVCHLFVCTCETAVVRQGFSGQMNAEDGPDVDGLCRYDFTEKKAIQPVAKPAA